MNDQVFEDVESANSAYYIFIRVVGWVDGSYYHPPRAPLAKGGEMGGDGGSWGAVSLPYKREAVATTPSEGDGVLATCCGLATTALCGSFSLRPECAARGRTHTGRG